MNKYYHYNCQSLIIEFFTYFFRNFPLNLILFNAAFVRLFVFSENFDLYVFIYFLNS